MQNDFQELINYRVNQAFDTIKEVEFQIENGFLNIAVNRIYYGIFYMLLALALKNNFKTSKHNQLLGWFNKEFIKTGIIDRETGKIAHKAYEDRTDGDYGLFIEFEKEEVIEKLHDMKRFLSELEKIIIEK